jgi:hypothetical protein
MILRKFNAALAFGFVITCASISCALASEPPVTMSPAPSHAGLHRSAQRKLKQLQQKAVPATEKSSQTAVHKPCGCHGKGRAGQNYKPGERWWAK